MSNFKSICRFFSLLAGLYAFQGAAVASAVEITDWLTSDQYQAAFSENRNNGYYPKFVQGKVANGEMLFQGFFDNDYGQDNWYSCHGLDSSAFATLDTTCRQNGIYPYWHQVFTDSNGVVRHQATWLGTDTTRISTLNNNATITNIDATSGTIAYYKLILPSASKHIILSATNNEDCTIHANFNSIPSQYDSYTLNGNNLIVNNPPSGTLYITVEPDASGHNAGLSVSAVTEYNQITMNTQDIVSITKQSLATDTIIYLDSSTNHPLLYVGGANNCLLYMSNNIDFKESNRDSHYIFDKNHYICLTEYNGSTIYAKIFCQDKTDTVKFFALPKSVSIPQVSFPTVPISLLLN